jgi:hypothetical protein
VPQSLLAFFYQRTCHSEPKACFDLQSSLAYSGHSVIARSKAPLLLLATAILIAIIALFLPPIPQPLAYHNFADQRGWLSIPNFGDVVSNLAFAVVGLSGLIYLLKPEAGKFADRRERWLYLVMFAGLILTAFGSAYYHLQPGNARLVWDRIPIMITFMALLAAVIAERVSVAAGLWLFPLLQAAGIGSVLVWRAGDCCWSRRSTRAALILRWSSASTCLPRFSRRATARFSRSATSSAGTR